MKSRTLRRTSALAFLVTIVPAGAVAQDSTPQLEEIVVTAAYREQGLQDVPVSISAVTGDTIVEATAGNTGLGLALVLSLNDKPGSGLIVSSVGLSGVLLTAGGAQSTATLVTLFAVTVTFVGQIDQVAHHLPDLQAPGAMSQGH